MDAKLLDFADTAEILDKDVRGKGTYRMLVIRFRKDGKPMAIHSEACHISEFKIDEHENYVRGKLTKFMADRPNSVFKKEPHA